MQGEGILVDIYNPPHDQVIFKVLYGFRTCFDLQRHLGINFRATVALELQEPVTQNWPITL